MLPRRVLSQLTCISGESKIIGYTHRPVALVLALGRFSDPIGRVTKAFRDRQNRVGKVHFRVSTRQASELTQPEHLLQLKWLTQAAWTRWV